MPVDDTIQALRALAYKAGQAKVAAAAEISDDTLRAILSDDKQPDWLKRWRRLEQVAGQADL